MLKVGLTGNIGSGKSLVAEMFSIYGVQVYHADDESKKFLRDPSVKEQVFNLFGESIRDGYGEIDKAALAEIVFSEEKALLSLNAILHPLVIEDFLRWCDAYQEHPYVIQEAAIIFESGSAGLFDKIIHVSCPKETAIERVVKRDGVDANAVMQRMRYQMDDAEKAKRADFVIRNGGTDMIIPQVISIHEKLSANSGKQNDNFIPEIPDHGKTCNFRCFLPQHLSFCLRDQPVGTD
jgi:dephospho-CoA kinase